MTTDDPTKPEFASWDSYSRFAHRVRRTRRYVWTPEIQAFLDTVLATLKDRDVPIQKGAVLYRAQRGVEYVSSKDEDGEERPEEPLGYTAKRMKPREGRASEGRANPAGIPVLYLASSEQTAISEVRPWVGSEVSVAQFKVAKSLKALGLSRGHGKSGILTLRIFSDRPYSQAEKEKAVWIDIDSAFSRPVTLSDDTADYVPTQILAELFRNAGYDAIVYRSQFGEKGYNVALFNLEDADAVTCAPFRVTKIGVGFEQFGNKWYKSKGTATKSKRPTDG
ncbi:MAG: RES family NAD+ phosphorylase [Alphaproteobacteria bacterium]